MPPYRALSRAERQPDVAYNGAVLTIDQAFSIARTANSAASMQRAREIEHGWYFGLDTEAIGCNGLIVNKKRGTVLQLGSAFPIERDLTLYDNGYHFQRYDLVITSVVRLDGALCTLVNLQMQVIEPTYEHGSVWRVPRPMSRDEIRGRLATTPSVFGDVSLYFVAEHLEHARAQGDFTFELFEYRPLPC